MVGVSTPQVKVVEKLSIDYAKILMNHVARLRVTTPKVRLSGGMRASDVN
jgi:hypothetical protein